MAMIRVILPQARAQCMYFSKNKTRKNAGARS
jgi:hypothetical protein